ncbi:MAG: molybdopterin molybdotransferase MoeA [Sphingomonadales bacterium]|jgi:molybdopterin molybdotransferase
MLKVEDALAKIIEPIKVLESEMVALDDAILRMLAEDVISKRTHPPSDVSAMDGYAIRAEDVQQAPTRLKVIGESAAGKAFQGALKPGQAVRIFTGAHLPVGSDTIVMQENTERLSPEEVSILQPAILKRHVRPKGLDVNEGDPILSKGTKLQARHIGLAATAGHAQLPVTRKPRVGLLFTGSELVAPGEPCGPDQIVNSNAPMLSALLRNHGAEVVNLGIAEDAPNAILEAAKGFDDVDLCITVGGASVGDHDLVQPVLSQAGLEVDFWKIAMKPGKPLIYGHFRGRPFIGLPGNPGSAMVCAQLYVIPAIQALSGVKSIQHHYLKAVLTNPLQENGPRQDYIRAVCNQTDEGLTVTPLKLQDSSMLSTFAKANCLLMRPPHSDEAKAGDGVHIIPLDF